MDTRRHTAHRVAGMVSDDFEQDPEDRSPEFVEPEESEVFIEPECDIDSPLYHAPNACTDPNCCYPQCDDDGAVGGDKYPGEDIWWKTIDNWNNL